MPTQIKVKLQKSQGQKKKKKHIAKQKNEEYIYT